MPAIIGLLTTFAPLIIQAGSWLISTFISGERAKQDALNAYYAAIQAHINDAMASVQSHDDFQNEVNALKDESKK